MAEGRRERVRTKIRTAGLQALAPHEVIECMLYPFIPRKDTSPLARRLLAEFVTLDGVFHASEEELLKVEGMPKSAAFYFPQLVRLNIHMRSEEVNRRRAFTGMQEAKSYFSDIIGHAPVEEQHALFLDAKRRLLCAKKMSNTSAPDSTELDIRQLTDYALKYKAAFVILGHNHPSGETTPSRADVHLSLAAGMTLKGIGVTLLDHIIVARGKSLSLWEEGYLDRLKQPL